MQHLSTRVILVLLVLTNLSRNISLTNFTVTVIFVFHKLFSILNHKSITLILLCSFMKQLLREIEQIRTAAMDHDRRYIVKRKYILNKIK